MLPTISGIPQSTENPLQTEFDRPWIEQEAAHARAMDQWRTEALDSIYNAANDWDTASKGKSFDLNFAPDQETARRDGINHSYLSVINNGDPIGGGALGAEVFRDQVAQQRFSGRGVGDWGAFNAEIKREGTERKNHKELAAAIGVEARKASLIASLEPTSGKGGTYAQWREANSAKIAPGKDADYMERWNAEEDAVREALDRYGPQLNDVWTAMSKDENPAAAAFRIYQDFTDDEDRSDFIDSLGLLARTLSPEQQATFFGNLAKETGRSFSDIGRNIDDYGKRHPIGTFGDTFPGGGALDELLSGKSYEQLKGDRKASRADYILRRNFASDVRRIERADFNPTRYLSEDSDDVFSLRTAERGAYAIPGALGSTAVAAIPYAGLPLTYASMEGAAYDQIRGNLIAGGMSRADAARRADDLAPVAAVPQALLEKVSASAWAGKLPVFERAMTALGNRITSTAARGAIRTGVGAIEETAIETSQDLIPAIVQDTAAALAQDIPEVDWNKELDGFASNTGSTFIAVLPLAIIGAAGGVRNDLRVQALAEAPPPSAMPSDSARRQTTASKPPSPGASPACSRPLMKAGPPAIPNPPPPPPPARNSTARPGSSRTPPPSSSRQASSPRPSATPKADSPSTKPAPVIPSAGKSPPPPPRRKPPVSPPLIRR